MAAFETSKGESMGGTLTWMVAALALLASSCCKSNAEGPAGSDPPANAKTTTPVPSRVDSPLKVGAAVMAPWSRTGKLYGGHVTALYGKLAHIDFNDGDRGWAEVSLCRPRGIPQPTPSDPCAFSVGDRVRAPWSRRKAMYSGLVAETHGKLALVNFLDGDRGWALCSEMRSR